MTAVEDIRYQLRWEWIPISPTYGNKGWVTHLQMKIDGEWKDVPTFMLKPKDEP